jgi:hypothetical protein
MWFCGQYDRRIDGGLLQYTAAISIVIRTIRVYSRQKASRRKARKTTSPIASIVMRTIRVDSTPKVSRRKARKTTSPIAFMCVTRYIFSYYDHAQNATSRHHRLSIDSTSHCTHSYSYRSCIASRSRLFLLLSFHLRHNINSMMVLFGAYALRAVKRSTQAVVASSSLHVPISSSFSAVSFSFLM